MATSPFEDEDPPAQSEETEIDSYSKLPEEAKTLDRDLYNILDTCISGPKRSILLGTQTRSFVQSWILLHKDMGATNSKRKSELMSNLLTLRYSGDSAKFSRYIVVLVQKIYDSHITVDDLTLCI